LAAQRSFWRRTRDLAVPKIRSKSLSMNRSERSRCVPGLVSSVARFRGLPESPFLGIGRIHGEAAASDLRPHPAYSCYPQVDRAALRAKFLAGTK
jgi:hypothetical protein